MPAEDLDSPPRFHTIVVAIDGSELSTYALRVAARIAKLEEARVVAVHVRHVAGAGVGAAAAVGTLDTSRFYDAAFAVARDAKKSATRVLGGAGLAGWTYEERTGPQIESLVEAINEHNGDLVVVGSHGHNPLYDLVVGSIAQGLITHAPVSVLVARPNTSHLETN
jgi:nucleotide-binding universal stress UspA family protein